MEIHLKTDSRRNPAIVGEFLRYKFFEGPRGKSALKFNCGVFKLPLTQVHWKTHNKVEYWVNGRLNGVCPIWASFRPMNINSDYTYNTLLFYNKDFVLENDDDNQFKWTHYPSLNDYLKENYAPGYSVTNHLLMH